MYAKKFHHRNHSDKVRVPDDMADAILDVGGVSIKGTSMSYKTFVDNIRKRFSSGRATPPKNKSDDTPMSQPSPSEPNDKKRKRENTRSAVMVTSSSESDSDAEHGAINSASSDKGATTSDSD